MEGAPRVARYRLSGRLVADDRLSEVHFRIAPAKIPPHSAVPFDQIDEFYFLPVSAPDEEIVGREELETLNRAIAELPPRCKHVFSLAKIERLPYRDIAEMLGISVKTVNYHIAYAMEALARTLKR